MGRRFASKVSPDGLRFSSNADVARRYRVRTLLVFVVLQCVLYNINLKLLPMWGDETFTVETAAETPARILDIVREDIHPPLYFLLAHWWNRIPIGPDPLVRLRALSALLALLTTVFLDRRWLRDAPQDLRNWFLLFWTFSPCLLLYSRMARSYSMQVFFASVAIWYLLRLAEDAAGGTTKHRVGTALGVILFTVNLAGLWTYYEARDLLNTGYLVPDQRISTEIVQHSTSEDTVVWVDAVSFDGTPLEYYLPKGFRIRWLTSPESVEAARAEINAGAIRHVWFVRSSHDISPGHMFEKLQSQMTETWSEHTLHPYVPFSPTHLAILRVLALLRHQDGNQPRQYMLSLIHIS